MGFFSHGCLNSTLVEATTPTANGAEMTMYFSNALSNAVGLNIFNILKLCLKPQQIYNCYDVKTKVTGFIYCRLWQRKPRNIGEKLKDVTLPLKLGA